MADKFTREFNEGISPVAGSIDELDNKGIIGSAACAVGNWAGSTGADEWVAGRRQGWGPAVRFLCSAGTSGYEQYREDKAAYPDLRRSKGLHLDETYYERALVKGTAGGIGNLAGGFIGGGLTGAGCVTAGFGNPGCAAFAIGGAIGGGIAGESLGRWFGDGLIDKFWPDAPARR